MKGLWSRAVPLMALAGAAASYAPSAQAASGYCYTVVDARNQIVVQGPDAPVDLSRPVAPQVEREYPGGHLVVTPDAPDCRLIHLPGGQARRSLTVSGSALPPAAMPPARPAVLRLPHRPQRWLPDETTATNPRPAVPAQRLPQSGVGVPLARIG